MSARSIVATVGRRIPPRFLRMLIGSPAHPSRLADSIHVVLNHLPGEGFPCLPCGGLLEGYRMRVDWMMHRSFIYGSWEPEVQQALVGLVRQGCRALDIGAHIGYYTLLLSKLVGNSGKVIAFEPLAENFKILEDNIRLNTCPQVEAIRKALWESPGQLELAVHSDTNETLPGRVSAVTPLGKRRVSVETVSLDDFCASRNERVDFIKIDVEGAEEQVLRGGQRVIASSHPALLIELHHFNGLPEDNPVPATLASLGYQVRWLDRSHSTSHIAAIWEGHAGNG